MNSAVSFNMLGSSNVQKPVNTQTASKRDSDQSFRKEMDKAFDKAPSSSNESKKDVNNKAEQSDKPKEDLGKSDETVNDPQKDVVSAEEQALAAMQLQQQQAAATVLIGEIVAELLPKSEEVPNLGAILEATSKESGDILSENPLEGEEGKIELPFQSNGEEDYSAMLKDFQSKNQENPTKDTEQNLTGKNFAKEEGVSELSSLDKNDNKPSTESFIEDGSEVPKESIVAKANTLDNSKVNVKVAEAPVDTSRADMAKQMADKIMHKISQGRHEFEMELNPKHLGKINIKMVFENGNAELVMSTSNAKAHQLLSAQTEALKAILEGNTGLDNIHLKQAENTDGQFDRDNFQEENKNEQQNKKQQQDERNLNESISFIDRLRLGLVEDLEKAV